MFAHAQTLVPNGGTGVTNIPENAILVGSSALRATSTYSPTVASINATSTNATSSLQKTSITGAISLLGEYFTNLTNYVRSLFSGTSPITYSAGTIGCVTADSTHAGCVTSADWNTFNNKTSFGEAWTLNAQNYLKPTTTKTVLLPDGLIATASSTFTNGIRASNGLTLDNFSYLKIKEASGSDVAVLGENSNGDVHLLANFVGHNVYIGFNAASAFQFGGTCCGGALPTSWAWDTSGTYGFKKDGGLELYFNASKNWGIGTVNQDNKLTVKAIFAGDGVAVDGAQTSNIAPAFTLSVDRTQKTVLGLALGAAQFSNVAAAGDAVLRHSNSGKNLIIDNAGSGDILFTTGTSVSNDTTKFTVKNGGNVGVGTTTPQHKFVVTSTPAGNGSISTTTTDFGTFGTTTSRFCINAKNSAGGDISIYYVGTTEVIENNACR